MLNMADNDEPVTRESIEELINHAIRNSYRVRNCEAKSEAFVEKCLKLFGKDYKFSVINNSHGVLCSHYPSKIVILEYLTCHGHTIDNCQALYDEAQIHDLMSKAKSARCRARFVVPVILFEGKHICRSSTLSGGPEMYGRQIYDYLTGYTTNTTTDYSTTSTVNSLVGSKDAEDIDGSLVGSNAINNEEATIQCNNGDPLVDTGVRGHDIQLLKRFNVGYIFDLMVEKKKVKYGLNVTSSEKVDSENRYMDFQISSMPYPGCEFFKEWKDNKYLPGGVIFDWSQGFIDTELVLPTTPTPPSNIDWLHYKEWDLVKLTQNYLKLLLHYLKHGDTGMLVHCISGWDRTPLFVSLVRISLWADGLVHPSLSAHEMLYLTIAYDWYLFGHNFPDRLYKGEDVFFFCFNFLQYIIDDEYNVNARSPHSLSSRNDNPIIFEDLESEFQPNGHNKHSHPPNNHHHHNNHHLLLLHRQQQQHNSSNESDGHVPTHLSYDYFHGQDELNITNGTSSVHGACAHPPTTSNNNTIIDNKDFFNDFKPNNINNNINNNNNNVYINNSLYLSSSPVVASTLENVDSLNNNNNGGISTSNMNNTGEIITYIEFSDNHSPQQQDQQSTIWIKKPKNSSPLPVPQQPQQLQQQQQQTCSFPDNTSFNIGSWQLVGTSPHSTKSSGQSERRQKLLELRSIFKSVYNDAIVRKATEESNAGILSSIIGNFGFLVTRNDV